MRKFIVDLRCHCQCYSIFVQKNNEELIYCCLPYHFPYYENCRINLLANEIKKVSILCKYDMTQPTMRKKRTN